MANTDVFSRLRRLFSTDIIIRNDGGNQLKVIGMTETDYNNRIILGERTPEIYEKRKDIYNEKNRKMEEIMAFRKQKTNYDEDVMTELDNNKYKHSGWIFY